MTTPRSTSTDSTRRVGTDAGLVMPHSMSPAREALPECADSDRALTLEGAGALWFSARLRHGRFLAQRQIDVGDQVRRRRLARAVHVFLEHWNIGGLELGLHQPDSVEPLIRRLHVGIRTGVPENSILT